MLNDALHVNGRKTTIITLKPSELPDFLEQANLLANIKQCYVCGKHLKPSDVRAVYFRGNSWTFICDKLSCQMKEDLQK